MESVRDVSIGCLSIRKCQIGLMSDVYLNFLERMYGNYLASLAQFDVIQQPLCPKFHGRGSQQMSRSP